MKIRFLLICLFMLSNSIFAEEAKRFAIVRDSDFNAVKKEVLLTDLISKHSYEGKYFKIVNGKSNIAISFNDNDDLQLKAATSYFHLSKARSFFVNSAKSQYVEELPQVIIRLDIKNVFNEVGHFANDNLNPQFNNALTVPEGTGYEPKEISPWGKEIWFRPSKVINLKDFKGQVDFGGSLKGSLRLFRNQTHMVNLQNFITSLLQGPLNSQSNLIRLVENSVLIELIYQTSDKAAAVFNRKIYRLDSALVPEIIYHEFSHVALSKSLELTHSTPVNEGLADFFAGKISNSKKLATNIKEYNLFNGKQVQKKQQYQLLFESGDFANSDFVFGLLWNIGLVVGNDLETQFMLNVADKLNTNVSIRDDLLNATLNTCKTLCKASLNDRIKLYELFQSKNL